MTKESDPAKEALNILEAHPNPFPYYPYFTSGRFGGRNIETLLQASVEMNPYEEFVCESIRQQLATKQRLVIVDAGAMLGTSLVILATKLEKMVVSDRITLVATNLEADFTVASALKESLFRWENQDIFFRLVDSVNQKYRSGQIPRHIQKMIAALRPMANPEEMLLIAQKSHLVRYLSGVARPQIGTAVKAAAGQTGIDFLHDFHGALEQAESL